MPSIHAETTDRFKSLRDRADEPFPKSFYFENPGDTAIGEFVRIDTGRTEFMEKCPIAVLKTESGELIGVWGFHTAMRDRLLDNDPKPGDSVLIRYEGLKRNRANTASYHNYTVLVEKLDPTPVEWDAPDDADDYDPDSF
jgi:hypothetical protein